MLEHAFELTTAAADEVLVPMTARLPVGILVRPRGVVCRYGDGSISRSGNVTTPC